MQTKNVSVLTGVLDLENNRDNIINFSKMHQALEVNLLSENNGSQKKIIGDNGGGSVTYSKISSEKLSEEVSGILSFN